MRSCQFSLKTLHFTTFMTTNDIFFNSVERLRSGWRFAFFFISFFLISGILSIFTSVFLSFLPVTPDQRTILFFIFNNFLTFLCALGLGWGVGKLFEDLPFKTLGVSISKNWFKDLILGIGLGIFAILLACLIAMIFGGLSFQINQTADFSAKLNTLGISFAIFVIGAANEEMIFRGYLLQTFSRAGLAWLAILLTSAFFASAHLQNPNASPIPIINTALAGIWFGVAYLKTRTLWLPFGLHFVWNWVQGAFLGIPVSGITELTPSPLLQAVDQGPTWLTGGHYGIEGGITCTIAIVVTTALIWFLPILKPTEDMVALTSHENPKEFA